MQSVLINTNLLISIRKTNKEIFFSSSAVRIIKQNNKKFLLRD